MLITFRVIGQRSTEFTGPAYLIKGAAEDVDAPLMRSPVGRGWLVPQEQAEDVLARLEQLGHSIEVTL